MVFDFGFDLTNNDDVHVICTTFLNSCKSVIQKYLKIRFAHRRKLIEKLYWFHR